MAFRQAEWHTTMSLSAERTINPIRQIVDLIDMSKIPKDREFISVSIGDPTKFPNLKTHPNVTAAFSKALKAGTFNGYPPSVGYLSTRAAVAERYSLPHIPVRAEDVFMTCGCSDAINMSFAVLADRGDNILFPCPGFSLYHTVCGRYGIEPRAYRCLPAHSWAVDVGHLESLVDARTKAIVVNNPSNPCGSVLTESNLRAVLAVARKYQVPVIADEIYHGMAFAGHTFQPVAALTTDVPVLTLGGLAKQFLVPGWRVGWVVAHDPTGVLAEVREGLRRLTTVVLGPNSVAQAAVPDILRNTPASFHESLMASLGQHAAVLFQELQGVPHLTAIRPQGAFYMMVKIDVDAMTTDIANDVDFANLLLQEEAVFVLPGRTFGIANYFRAVLCPPADTLREVGRRLHAFCTRHSRATGGDRGLHPRAKL